MPCKIILGCGNNDIQAIIYPEVPWYNANRWDDSGDKRDVGLAVTEAQVGVRFCLSVCLFVCLSIFLSLCVTSCLPIGQLYLSVLEY